MENVRKHRDIKLVTTERRRSYLVSEPNYHTTKFFREHSLVIEMKKKTELLLNKPVYLGLSILELSKILKKQSCVIWIPTLMFLCFNVYIKTDDFTKILQKMMK